MVLKVSIVLYMLWMNNLKLTSVLSHRRESIFQLNSFKEKFFLLSKQTVVLGGFLSGIQICVKLLCLQLQLEQGLNYNLDTKEIILSKIVSFSKIKWGLAVFHVLGD